ncbi:ParA family protein [Methanobrevibacter filiformis]|uniref:Sporulation initiation inhibitor protein Soj n=1 Tax=Methanobrevibacter filiformis TaxID=55758 RepID=A0A162FNC2_9EURY|nr:ParA family protein [Methanobrevibacter filiformis]KZX12630.1 sporulation initiation inhibitor protein Soj [Methanobrevibacter filiformis]
MGEILSIINQKGGCGKTTTAVNFSTSLTVMGKKVLVVDMDPQANATTSFGIDKLKLEYTVYSAISGEVNVEKAIKPTFIKNLFVLPSNISLSGVEMELSKHPEYYNVLKDILSNVKDLFDYIIIDVPPSLGVITVNALVACDGLIIPIQAEYYSLEGLADLMNTIQLVEKRLKSPAPIRGIVLTLYDSRTKLGREVYSELKKYFVNREYIFKTVIPRNIKLAEAPSYGKPCLAYDPESRGTKAYMKLAKEFLEITAKTN